MEANMITDIDIDLSAKDLADKARITPRMINIYRAQAEQRLNRKLGQKRGKTIYFNPEDQREILKSRMEGTSADEVAEQHQRQTSTDFQGMNNTAEDGMIGSLATIAQQNDERAISMGKALGARFNSVLYASMMQEMNTGFLQMQQGLGELTSSLGCALPGVNRAALTGGKPNLLLEADD